MARHHQLADIMEATDKTITVTNKLELQHDK
jgi:hypothetical protein